MCVECTRAALRRALREATAHIPAKVAAAVVKKEPARARA